jgi:hypothetical protein
MRRRNCSDAMATDGHSWGSRKNGPPRINGGRNNVGGCFFGAPLRHVQAGTCRARANQEAVRPYRVRFLASECLVTRVFHSPCARNCSILISVIVGCTYPSLTTRSIPVHQPAKHTRPTNIRTRPADWPLECPCSLPSEQFPDAHLVYHSSPGLSLLHLIQLGNLI